MNLYEAYSNYKQALDASESQLKQIRLLESEKDSHIVDGKMSKEGVKLLNKIDDMYIHRMNVVVPAVADANKQMRLVTLFECGVESNIVGDIK